MIVIKKLDLHTTPIVQSDFVVNFRSGCKVGNSEAGTGVIDLNIMERRVAGIDDRDPDMSGAAACSRKDGKGSSQHKEPANDAVHGFSVDGFTNAFAVRSLPAIATIVADPAS